MHSDMTGIILSGGKSTRMGENKSLLDLGGEMVIERVVKLMQEVFPRVILSTNTPDEYSFLGMEMVEDQYKHAGPLAGIHSGMINSDTERNFILSCDMPMMTKEVIDFMVEFDTEKSIVIAHADGFNQQLAGVYSKSCLAIIEEILADSSMKENRSENQKKRGCPVFELVKKMDGKIINAEDIIPNYRPGTFFNMNKPREYEEIKNILLS
jgi:molybdenum cofactor guanylyltransferase